MNLAKLPHEKQITIIKTASAEALKAAWASHCAAQRKTRKGGNSWPARRAKAEADFIALATKPDTLSNSVKVGDVISLPKPKRYTPPD